MTITNGESSQPGPPPWSQHPAVDAGRPETVFETTTVSLGSISHVDTGQDTDHLIYVFRSQMASQFPFVVIPAHVSAQYLRADNPFLCLAIVVAASCKCVARQVALRKEMMREICERVLMQNQKSLELLQGLLVFIAW